MNARQLQQIRNLDDAALAARIAARESVLAEAQAELATLDKGSWQASAVKAEIRALRAELKAMREDDAARIR